MPKKSKKRFLVVLGSGGHTAQILKLLDLLGNRYEYEYVIRYDDQLSRKKIKIGGKVYRIHNPRSIKDNIFVIALKTIRNATESLIILLKSKSDLILSAGPGSAVPLCVLGKLLGKKVIFLESWSRVYNPSYSGRLVYPFSDLFFVQWPEIKKEYPKAIYAGRLL
jgi:UDP-N-acetylglucosamine:LPS N-acetylglucosamine transferase